MNTPPKMKTPLEWAKLHTIDAEDQVILAQLIETAIAEQRERAEKAEACYAEMREVIEHSHIKRTPEHDYVFEVRSHALSSNCGKDHIHKRELEKTIEFLHMALEPVFPGTWLDEAGHEELARLEALTRKEQSK